MADTQSNPQTPVLIGGTLSTSIKSAYVDGINEASAAAGLTVEWIRAMEAAGFYTNTRACASVCVCFDPAGQ